MNWWEISLIALGSIMLVRLIFAPYWIYKEQKEKLDKSQADALDVSNKLAETRKQIQLDSSFNVNQIPNILGDMHTVVRNIYQEKLKTHYSTEQCTNVIMTLLDIDNNKSLLIENNYRNKEQVRHMIKVFRKHMGLKKNDYKKAKQWMLLIANALDKNNMGLDLTNNQKYCELKERLEINRRPISTTRLSASIDNFIEGLEGMYSIRLLTKFGEIDKCLNKFPDEAKTLLIELDNKTEAIMHNGMVNVNIPLEAWIIGDTNGNGER
jgi:hypothetical protein